MPAESIPALLPPSSPSIVGNTIKCSQCGGSGFASGSSRGGEELVILEEEIERVCAGCWRAEQAARDRQPQVYTATDSAQVREHDEGQGVNGIGLGLRGMTIGSEDRLERESSSEDVGLGEGGHSVQAVPISVIPASTNHSNVFATSLPPQHTPPWATHTTRIPPIKEERPGSVSPPPRVMDDRPSNPLLDVTRSRVSSMGRGALYPGSVFKGTQTSGRSAYDVEVKFIDVNIPESTVSGYLSISHLTDTHPHLTTFFSGEIIGPKYGFITGPRFGATEHDDMRHWGRFEQFRRPATRADMIRPELLLRDPQPDRSRVGPGESRGRERDFVFLRIKERFLVPDHTVRDISGASFAGFYFAMIDLNPPADSTNIPLTPASPTAPKSPLPATPTTSASQYFPNMSPAIQRRQSSGNVPPIAPTFARRMSSSGPRSPNAEMPPPTPGARRRRESSGAGGGAGVGTGGGGRAEKEVPREATIRGYYFHSLNQEPFQELFLTHVPIKSSAVFELR